MTHEITTRRRSHFRYQGETRAGTTYRASIWDHETETWEPYRSGIRLMGLRAVIRELERGGWSPLSYLIERED